MKAPTARELRREYGRIAKQARKDVAAMNAGRKSSEKESELPGLLLCLAIVIAAILLLTGCGALPAGSGLRIVSGFTKDGPSAKAVLDIPFTQGDHERVIRAPGAATLVVRR